MHISTLPFMQAVSWAHLRLTIQRLFRDLLFCEKGLKHSNVVM